MTGVASFLRAVRSRVRRGEGTFVLHWGGFGYRLGVQHEDPGLWVSEAAALVFLRVSAWTNPLMHLVPSWWRAAVSDLSERGPCGPHDS